MRCLKRPGNRPNDNTNLETEFDHILSFGTSNAKLIKQKTATFSLPAGYTCPGAKDCHAWFNREEKKLHDGKHQTFRCYAAQQEAYLPSLRNSVDKNLRLLKAAGSVERMAKLIHKSLPPRAFERIRVHQNGDFFSGDYFMAWMEVARRNPETTFYAYTKSLPIWVRFQALIPSNFVLTASAGGKFDSLIEKHGLRKAVVVFHPDEAAALGLEIDHDDSHARRADGKDFALLIHGQQSKGSDAAIAMRRLAAENIDFSYSKKKKPQPGPSRSLKKVKLGPSKR